MTCINIGNGYICGNFGNPKRLKRKGTSTKAIYYFQGRWGPDFYLDRACENLIEDYSDVPNWAWEEWNIINHGTKYPKIKWIEGLGKVTDAGIILGE